MKCRKIERESGKLYPEKWTGRGYKNPDCRQRGVQNPELWTTVNMRNSNVWTMQEEKTGLSHNNVV